DFDSLQLQRFRSSARFNKTGAFNRSANLPWRELYPTLHQSLSGYVSKVEKSLFRFGCRWIKGEMTDG
ncbi:MAG: hypothetical protein KA779_14730, partial [Propionivibrio sp.]|nr:hypothetical protein [Propionivibrio sp.]